MTIQQANEFFAACPLGFAEPSKVRAVLEKLHGGESDVRYIGVAGTAGKTAVASMTAEILMAAGFRTGIYTAGFAPLRGRIAVDGKPVEARLFTAAAGALKAAETLPVSAAELCAARLCFEKAECEFAVVELPDTSLAALLPQMPVCAVTHLGPDGTGHSVERLARLAADVMRADSTCVTCPDQPKAALTELIVAAKKYNCALTVPDKDDLAFKKARRLVNSMDYGGYDALLPFLGRHAAANAAVAVELALALWRKGVEIPDEAILNGLAAVENHSSIRVLRRRPLVILDACHTPEQAAALTAVLHEAELEHLSVVLGLDTEQGADDFFATLETGALPEKQTTEKERLPGMADNAVDKMYLVMPDGSGALPAQQTDAFAKFHFDTEICDTLAQALEKAQADANEGVLVCGSARLAAQAEALLK